jgi:branched-chain amino acid transport system substrate-binding protein
MTTASIESRAQLRYALEQGAERIAVVAQHDAWGRARYEPLIEAMENQGIEPVVDEEMTVDANDATPQALAIQQADADAVIYVLYSKPGAILARDLFKLGHKPLLIGETGISDPVAFVEQVGVPGASDKFVTITPVCCSPSSPKVAEWRKRIESMFPGDRLSVFNLFGVGSSQVMVEALRRAGPDLTREKYLDAMESIENYETDAYAGKIDCSAPDSNQCNKTVSWIKAVDGDVEVISSTRVE